MMEVDLNRVERLGWLMGSPNFQINKECRLE
jgi:hypothetical protein